MMHSACSVAAVVLAALSAIAQEPASDPVGVYGYIGKVVFEPDAGLPERVQVWGTFCVAAPGHGSDYQDWEGGYLYFDARADSRAAVDDWNKLSRLSVTFPKRIVAFAGRGTSLRVRTADEKPERPDRYMAGIGVAEMNQPPHPFAALYLAARMGGYALVDRVVMEPNADYPERIQVWGVFAMGSSAQNSDSYLAPQRGYLYLAPDGRGAGDTIRTWRELASVAGIRQVVGFVIGCQVTPVNPRVRPPDEQPSKPDSYPAAGSLRMTRPDTEYAPVRSLLEFH